MTTRALIIGGLAFAVFLQACRHGATPELSVSPVCGSQMRWAMPPTTDVELTAAGSRIKEQLVSQARIDAFILAAEAACRASGGVYPESLDAMLAHAGQPSKCLLRHTGPPALDDPHAEVLDLDAECSPQ